jgi:hypothetical protein
MPKGILTFSGQSMITIIVPSPTDRLLFEAKAAFACHFLLSVRYLRVSKIISKMASRMERMRSVIFQTL